MLCRGVYFPPVTVLSPRHHVFIRYMKPICRDSTDVHLFLKPLRYRLGCACLFTTSGSVVFLEFSHNQEN